MLCARGSIELSEWVDHVLGQEDQSRAPLHDVVHQLSMLYQATLSQMNDVEGRYRLLLPDDDDSLSERVSALASWCQGFVYGLAAGGIREDTELPEDSAELMRDILEIGRAASDEELEEEGEDREDDEEAYMEIEEYVRMGALLIYEELQPIQATQTIH
jgi:yecA family protein